MGHWCEIQDNIDMILPLVTKVQQDIFLLPVTQLQPYISTTGGMTKITHTSVSGNIPPHNVWLCGTHTSIVGDITTATHISAAGGITTATHTSIAGDTTTATHTSNSGDTTTARYLCFWWNNYSHTYLCNW